MKKYGAPSVKKAFAILSAISSSSEGMGVSDLAKKLKMAKSTVHGMTSALEELGAVLREPLTKKYKLGFTLLEIGRSAYTQIDLKTSARPITEELMAKTQTSVFIGIRNWGQVTIIDIVESRQELNITAPVGSTIPLFAGAVGKVFMASMSKDQAANSVRAITAAAGTSSARTPDSIAASPIPSDLPGPSSAMVSGTRGRPCSPSSVRCLSHTS